MRSAHQSAQPMYAAGLAAHEMVAMRRGMPDAGRAFWLNHLHRVIVIGPNRPSGRDHRCSVEHLSVRHPAFDQVLYHQHAGNTPLKHALKRRNVIEDSQLIAKPMRLLLTFHE